MPFRVIDSKSEEILLSCDKVQELIDYVDHHSDEWNVKMIDITGGKEDGH